MNCSNVSGSNSSCGATVTTKGCISVVDNLKIVLPQLIGLSIVSIFTIFGNTLVCVAFLTNRRLRILTNFYVASLAISDVLVAVFNIPLWMYWSSIGYCNYFMNPLYEAYVILDILCGTASIWNMVAISIDRLLAVVHPAVYRARAKKPKFAAWIIISVWAFSTCMGLLRMTYTMWNYALFLVIMSFFVPLTIIIVSYGKIYRVVRQRAKWTGSVLMEIRLAWMLAIVIGAFVLCWGPFFVFSIVAFYCRRKCSYGKAPEIIKWLQYASSCINPVVYTIRNREFRYTFQRLIFHCKTRNGSYGFNETRPTKRFKCCGCISIPDFETYETRSRGGTFTEESQISVGGITVNSAANGGSIQILSFTNSVITYDNRNGDATRN